MDSFSLVVTRTGLFDISLDSVTNIDGDRDMVEVMYTVSGGAASSFDLGVYDSTDPFFNFNSDTLIDTFSVATGLCGNAHG